MSTEQVPEKGHRVPDGAYIPTGRIYNEMVALREDFIRLKAIGTVAVFVGGPVLSVIITRLVS